MTDEANGRSPEESQEALLSAANTVKRVGEGPGRCRANRPGGGEHGRRERDQGRRRVWTRRRPGGATETLTPNAISDLVDAVPANGCSPDTISCSITHRDQTSSASSAGRPARQHLRRQIAHGAAPRGSSVAGLASETEVEVPRFGADQRLPDRTNCRMWGSSPVTTATREDPQPSESAGSPMPQVMWEPSGPSRRTFKLSCWLTRGQHLVVGGGGLQLLGRVQFGDVRQTTVGQLPKARHAFVGGMVVLEVLAFPGLRGAAPGSNSAARRPRRPAAGFPPPDAASPATAPPGSLGSYRARIGGGLQDCPLWGVRPRRWRARLPVLERLVEGGRLRGDGRADDEVPGGRGGWDVRRGRGANPPIVRGQPVSLPLSAVKRAGEGCRARRRRS